MKWILVAVLMLFHNPLIASTQYSQAQCNELKKQREYIRKRMNAGYGVAEGNWLNERDRELFQTIGLRCKQASSSVSHSLHNTSENIYTPMSTSLSEPAKSALKDMPDWSAENAIFSGSKAAAWADFYQVPTHCRQKTLSETDFVKCANHKAEQRQQFIKKWEKQQHAVVNISPGIEQNDQQIQQATFVILDTYIAENKNSELPSSLTLSVQAESDYQRHFRWFGLSFVVLLAAGGWLIWRK
ncbi:MAG: hypothetical protein NWQ54_12610 [Paraglaciecola sp.]|nr:hypothetical protein [Paraglaciecola sp.]